MLRLGPTLAELRRVIDEIQATGNGARDWYKEFILLRWHQIALYILQITDQELSERKNKWKPTEKMAKRGYVHLYQNHVEQAHLGADMDFLKGGSGSEVLRDSH